MKKTCLFLLVVSLLLACVAPLALADGEPAKIEFWTFQALHVQFYEDAAASWNAANPDRQIELVATTLPYDDMHNKLQIALQSGVGAPDIVDIEINKFGSFLKGTPQFMPLNDAIADVRDKFVESRLLIYSKGDTLYGLPTHVGASVIYYNTEILEKAGIDYTTLTTWDKFHEAGKVVLEKTGVPMITWESGDWCSYGPMVSQLGDLYTDKDANVVLDDVNHIRALQFQRDMIDDGTAIVAPGDGHHSEEFYGMMNQGGAASVNMPSWYMGRFVEYMPDLKGKIVMAPMPAWEEGGNRSAGMGGTGTAVTNQAKDPQLAVDFLAYAKASEEGNIKIWTVLGFDPPRWDVWTNPAVLENENVYTDFFGKDIFNMLYSIKDEINPVYSANEAFPLCNDVLKRNVMPTVLVDRSKTAEEALHEAAEEVRSEMDF